MSAIADGDRVRIHYTARREDGQVFHSSRPGEPLEFVAGSCDLIEAVSKAVVGMEEGEARTLRVPPDAGYGPRRPGLEHRVPRRLVPGDAAIGDPVELVIGGSRAVLWLRELGGEDALLDGNHPLAGETIVVELEIVERVSSG